MEAQPTVNGSGAWRIIQKIMIYLIIGSVIFILLGAWYNHTYRMDFVESYEVNKTSLNRSLLIATQGSDYKNQITDRVVEHFKTEDVFVRVLDATALDQTTAQDWDAIVLLHTWEMWKPPAAVKQFADHNYKTGKVVVLTTSGNGAYKMEGVDAITGASDIGMIQDHSEDIINQVEKILVSQ